MTPYSRLIPLSVLSACLILQGCTSVKKTLGIERDPPDEFCVTPSIQPLDMPPDFFVLPQPRPGAPRPQDEKALKARQEKLLGAPTGKVHASPGQKALLDKVGVEEGQEQVRYEIDAESKIESSKSKPILEQLGIRKETPNGEAINPYEEASKLQEQGIPQNQTVPRS